MKINKISVAVEIDGIPCLVMLPEMDESRMNLLVQVISGFCDPEGTLKVAKMPEGYKFEEIT